MKLFSRMITVLLLLTLIILPGACAKKNDVPQVFTGYITSEDDFVAGLCEDTAFMIYMKPMAQSGLGITFQENGKWVFYYFDGKISTGDSKDSNGDWMFDGTGSQLKAWDIVEDQMTAGGIKEPVPIKVVGTLTGVTATNPGPDKDGKIFKVITVAEMTPYTVDNDTAAADQQTESPGSADVGTDNAASSSVSVSDYPAENTSSAPASDDADSKSSDADVSPAESSAEPIEAVSADAVVLERIAIAAPAVKLSYNVGEALDIKGLKIQGYYSDGSTAILPTTSVNITGFDNTQPNDEKKLTITYDGKSVTFTVAILQPVTQVTFTGYITSEDDFAADLGEDTAAMVYMRLMALSGLGITFQENGQWVFYYFDGSFSTDNSKDADGKWVFDGTGSQKKAWDIVAAQMAAGDKFDPVPVKVTGILKGDEATNPGPDRDGLYFQVLTVTRIEAN